VNRANDPVGHRGSSFEKWARLGIVRFDQRFSNILYLIRFLESKFRLTLEPSDGGAISVRAIVQCSFNSGPSYGSGPSLRMEAPIARENVIDFPVTAPKEETRDTLEKYHFQRR
jgi:hypothetical protein